MILAANSYGGVGRDTILAANAFHQFRGGRITCYASEQCWSAGLLLMAGADRRVGLRSCSFMLHEPLMDLRQLRVDAQRFSSLATIDGIFAEAHRSYANYFDFLDQRTGQQPGFWRSKAQPTGDNHYHSANDMLEWGLLTHIVDDFEELRAIALA